MYAACVCQRRKGSRVGKIRRTGGERERRSCMVVFREDGRVVLREDGSWSIVSLSSAPLTGLLLVAAVRLKRADREYQEENRKG